MATILQTKKQITDTLTPVVGTDEARAMAAEMLTTLLGLSPAQLVINGTRSLEPVSDSTLNGWTQRVVAGEPLQYILGHAWFMGMNLKVTPAVLIPRPETAGLVDMITDRYAGASDLSVLDVGTGSGCIAIALARALSFADVTAVDVSEAALDVARENAKALHTTINFRQMDILTASSEAFTAGSFDIVVSNPPYIAMHEKAKMEARVYDHEPTGALFVPDDDPLVFYNAIARLSQSWLKPGGRLYFEINPLFADGLKKLLNGLGFSDVDIIRDYKGNYRYAVCQR